MSLRVHRKPPPILDADADEMQSNPVNLKARFTSPFGVSGNGRTPTLFTMKRASRAPTVIPRSAAITRFNLIASAERIFYRYTYPPLRIHSFPLTAKQEPRTAAELNLMAQISDIFHAQKEYCFRAMEQDAFPRFLRSKAFGNLTPAFALVRLIAGLLTLWIGLAIAFSLIFLDVHPKSNSSSPSLSLAVLFLVSHQYELDPFSSSSASRRPHPSARFASASPTLRNYSSAARSGSHSSSPSLLPLSPSSSEAPPPTPIAPPRRCHGRDEPPVSARVARKPSAFPSPPSVPDASLHKPSPLTRAPPASLAPSSPRRPTCIPLAAARPCVSHQIQLKPSPFLPNPKPRPTTPPPSCPHRASRAPPPGVVWRRRRRGVLTKEEGEGVEVVGAGANSAPSPPPAASSPGEPEPKYPHPRSDARCPACTSPGSVTLAYLEGLAGGRGRGRESSESLRSGESHRADEDVGGCACAEEGDFISREKREMEKERKVAAARGRHGRTPAPTSRHAQPKTMPNSERQKNKQKRKRTFSSSPPARTRSSRAELVGEVGGLKEKGDCACKAGGEGEGGFDLGDPYPPSLSSPHPPAAQARAADEGHPYVQHEHPKRKRTRPGALASVRMGCMLRWGWVGVGAAGREGEEKEEGSVDPQSRARSSESTAHAQVEAHFSFPFPGATNSLHESPQDNDDDPTPRPTRPRIRNARAARGGAARPARGGDIELLGGMVLKPKPPPPCVAQCERPRGVNRVFAAAGLRVRVQGPEPEESDIARPKSTITPRGTLKKDSRGIARSVSADVLGMNTSAPPSTLAAAATATLDDAADIQPRDVHVHALRGPKGWEGAGGWAGGAESRLESGTTTELGVDATRESGGWYLGDNGERREAPAARVAVGVVPYLGVCHRGVEPG
ncbi:hypothetical protein B0H11DRAFT_1898249 [Mycena galericulata]|nr:hypothetical protein B0H11DRAFT_1898249 [Mycena galericulata]